MNYADIREHCETMVAIINKMQYSTDKSELNDLSVAFDIVKTELMGVLL